jgi:hypothetical protein
LASSAASYQTLQARRIFSGLTLNSTTNWLLIPARRRFGACRSNLETVFAVSLSLGQENFSAAQAKRSDGVGVPSAARASMTPEVAASLLGLQE